MRIRPAEPSDGARVAEIYAHYVAASTATFDEEAPDGREMAEKIAAAELPFLVAERDEGAGGAGLVEGFAYLARYHPRSAYRHTAEWSVYVAEEARGRGIGRALLERLLADAPAAGVRELIAIIGTTDGEQSIALHRALGFREVGHLTGVGYKHGRWHDTVLMQRSLL